MIILPILIFALLAIGALYVARGDRRKERARLEIVTAGRPSLTSQEFAARYFTGPSVAIAARCHELFAENYEFDASRISPDDKLCQELLFAAHDCLDAWEFVRALEREFKFKFTKTERKEMLTIREIVEAVLKHIQINRTQSTS